VLTLFESHEVLKTSLEEENYIALYCIDDADEDATVAVIADDDIGDETDVGDNGSGDVDECYRGCNVDGGECGGGDNLNHDKDNNADGN